MKKSLILVSGGMDSLVAAALAKKSGEELYFLHLDYGQNTQIKERACFEKMADFFEVKESKILDVQFLKEIGGSSLTQINEGGSGTYVPFRNSIILSLAMSWAEVIKVEKIYFGAVEEDAPGYPDCRPSYFETFNKLIEQGSMIKNVEIVTPLIHLSKKEIILKAFELKAPIELSWSCYVSNEKACGKCESCLLRAKGFFDAGKIDPII